MECIDYPVIGFFFLANTTQENELLNLAQFPRTGFPALLLNTLEFQPVVLDQEVTRGEHGQQAQNIRVNVGALKLPTNMKPPADSNIRDIAFFSPCMLI